MLNEQFLSVFKVTGLNRLKQKSPHYSLSYFFSARWMQWVAGYAGLNPVVHFFIAYLIRYSITFVSFVDDKRTKPPSN